MVELWNTLKKGLKKVKSDYDDPLLAEAQRLIGYDPMNDPNNNLESKRRVAFKDVAVEKEYNQLEPAIRNITERAPIDDPSDQLITAGGTDVGHSPLGYHPKNLAFDKRFGKNDDKLIKYYNDNGLDVLREIDHLHVQPGKNFKSLKKPLDDNDPLLIEAQNLIGIKRQQPQMVNAVAEQPTMRKMTMEEMAAPSQEFANSPLGKLYKKAEPVLNYNLLEKPKELIQKLPKSLRRPVAALGGPVTSLPIELDALQQMADEQKRSSPITSGIVGGTTDALEKVVNSLATPANIGIAATGAAVPALAKPITTGFGLGMASAVPESIKQAIDAPDLRGKVGAGLDALIGAVGGGALLKSGLSRGVKAPAMEPDAPMPESPITVEKQVDSVVKGNSPAVLITPGEVMPEIPQGMQAIDSQVGTWIYDPKKLDAEVIQDMVADGTHGELLGHLEPKSDATTIAVQAKQGPVELKTSAVSPENVDAQAKILQEQFPDSEIEVKPVAEKIPELVNQRQKGGKWSNSWVVTNRSNGKVIGEFYDKKNVDKFDPNKVIIEPAHEYLPRLNAEIKTNSLQEKLPEIIEQRKMQPTVFQKIAQAEKERVSRSNADPENKAKRSKAFAYEMSAIQRGVERKPTAKEIQNARKYLESNHVGKIVQVDGLPAMVEKTSFGKTGVRFHNGELKYVGKDKISSNPISHEQVLDHIQKEAQDQLDYKKTFYDIKEDAPIETKPNSVSEPQIAAKMEEPPTISKKETVPPGEFGTEVRGVAKSVEAKAVENKLVESFGDLPEYNKINVKDQANKATALLDQDYELAKRIAMGEEAAPSGILPESVMLAVENHATKMGDIETLRQLGTSSGLVKEGTYMGQRIRMHGERSPHSALNAIKEIANVREKVAESRYGKELKAAKTKIVNDVKKAVDRYKPTVETWGSFIESIKC